MKVYIKKRWVKRQIAKQHTWCIPQGIFKDLGGKVFNVNIRGTSICIAPLDDYGWWLPFDKVKLVSR